MTENATFCFSIHLYHWVFLVIDEQFQSIVAACGTSVHFGANLGKVSHN